MKIKINKLWTVKPLLFITQFISERYCVLMCKGYADDFELFTAIYWQDDFENCLDYENYQLWIGNN